MAEYSCSSPGKKGTWPLVGVEEQKQYPDLPIGRDHRLYISKELGRWQIGEPN